MTAASCMAEAGRLSFGPQNQSKEKPRPAIAGQGMKLARRARRAQGGKARPQLRGAPILPAPDP